MINGAFPEDRLGSRPPIECCQSMGKGAAFQNRAVEYNGLRIVVICQFTNLPAQTA